MLSASLHSLTEPQADRGPASALHLCAALQGLSAGLFTFTDGLDILFSNQRLTLMLGIERDVANGTVSLPALFEGSPILSATLVDQICEACRDIVHTLRPHTMDLMSRDNPARFFAMQIAPLADQTFLATIVEVTEQRSAEAQAIAQAMCDPLTGLPNRALFHDRVAAALDTGFTHDGDAPEERRHTVMAIDLDRFKGVNDTLGHAIGDGLLCLVSRRLRAMLRPHDVVARLGGDEFALLISPAPGRAAIEQLALRIVDVLGRPYLVDGQLVNIGASVGVALAPEHGRTHDTLLRSADLALYDAKDNGRGGHSVFKAVMDTRASARRQIEIDLRKALALREFELHYQPQVDLERHAIVGFEALLRWRHPERGLISPADFIPLAEEIGLIVPLGEWVLTQACVEAVRWPDGVSIAVNVSPCQFEDTDRLVAAVRHALAFSGLPGRRLEIEITESVLLRDAAGVLTALRQLRSMDVRVAMDDFGTGYSSLSQLHSFPFDKIKIDRSFVKDQADENGQNAIIRAISALGTSLGMSTIAEGVETQGQLERIRDGGCTLVQGYLFSRPIPVGEVGPMIALYNNPPILDSQVLAS